MKMTRIYTDSQGDSHFENLGEIKFNFVESIGQLSETISATQVRIHLYGPELENDWHNPPLGRTCVIFLEGEQEIEVSNGTKRIFSYGDILMIEDLTGRGHRTRSKTGGKSILLT